MCLGDRYFSCAFSNTGIFLSCPLGIRSLIQSLFKLMERFPLTSVDLDPAFGAVLHQVLMCGGPFINYFLVCVVVVP